MARGKFITKDVRNLVARLYNNHPSYTAKKIRNEVNKELRRQNKISDSKWPGVSTVQKIIQNLSKDIFWDSEWTIQSLIKCEIPSEAVSIVMDAYAQTVAWGIEKRLTVREARWVARLYRVVTNLEELTIIARECALNEQFDENTRELENTLVEIDFMHRAITGKPAATYKYLGNGNFEFTLNLDKWTGLDIMIPNA